MSSGGFFGGFAQGFGQMYGITQQNRRARENNILRQRQMDLQERRFSEQMGLERKRLGLSEKRLSLEEQQMENLEEHREYDQMLRTKQHELNLRKQDFDTMTKMLEFMDPAKSKAVRKNAIKLFGLHLGIDTKGETFKAMQDLFTNLEPEELDHVSELIIQKYPNLSPGQGQALAKMMLEDPDTAMNAMKFFAGEEDPEDLQLKTIIGDDGKPVYVPEQEAIGKQAPGPNFKSSSQIQREEALAGRTVRDNNFMEGLIEKGTAAEDRKAALDTFLIAIDQQEFETGTAANLRASAARWAEFLNIEPEDIGLDKLGVGDASIAEVMEAMSNQLALKFAVDLSRLTNLSLSKVTDSMPNLLRTPKGNSLILNIMKAEDDRLMLYKSWAEEWDELYGGPRPDPDLHPNVPSLQEKIRIDKAVNPIVTEEQLAEWNELAETGKGINLEELANDAVGAAEGAAGKLIPPNFDGIEYDIVGKDALGNNLVEIGRGPLKRTVPAFWSREKFDQWVNSPEHEPGSLFIWLPAEPGEQLYRKTPEPEGTDDGSGVAVGSEEWKEKQISRLLTQLNLTGASEEVIQGHVERFRAELDKMYPSKGE